MASAAGIFCLCWMLLAATSAVLSDEHQVDTDIRAMEFLKQFSYMGYNHPDANFGQMSDQNAFRKAMKTYQMNMGLSVTGVLDLETRALMSKPRCGMPDLVNMRDVMRKKRYALSGTRWESDVLTYMFMNYSPDLSPMVIEREFDRAFKTWSNVTNLQFQKITSGRADIEILFYPGSHGDGNPFDGPGGVLAHAYFPTTAAIGGDAHFDDDESWTSQTEYGTNLYQVAVHELGHSLGLAHSNDYGAIMFPSYLGYQENFQLGEDDIRGIQALYGVKTPRPPHPTQAPTPQPTLKPPTQPPMTPNRERFCQAGTVDAIAAFDDEVYAFQGDMYALLGEAGIEPGYPRTISSGWPDLPNHIDAILDINNRGVLIFFKNDRYYRYDGRKERRRFVGDAPISKDFQDLPTHLDAAFVWEMNEHMFVIKGDKYYRLMVGPPLFYVVKDEDINPKDLGDWQLPVDTVDAATSYGKRTYFFNGKDYYRYNDINMEPDAGYPKSIAKYWFGCDGDAWHIDMEMKVAKDSSQIVAVPGFNSSPNLSRTASLVTLLVSLTITFLVSCSL